MDKFFKCFFAFAIMIVSLTGCRDDAELADPGKSGNPEQEAVGTWSGTWTVNVDGVAESHPGTLTLAAGEYAYSTTVTVVCPDTNLDRTSQANIIKNSAGYQFANELDSNPIGAIFKGSISNDGTATIGFKIVQRSGKKNKLFIYSFTGSK